MARSSLPPRARSGYRHGATDNGRLTTDRPPGRWRYEPGTTDHGQLTTDDRPRTKEAHAVDSDEDAMKLHGGEVGSHVATTPRRGG